MARLALALVVVATVAACTSVPTPTPTALPPTHTPAPSLTPSPVPSPTLTATPTPLPEDLLNQLATTYRVMLLIQIDAELLDEAASRVQSGELEGPEAFGTILGIAAVVDAVDQAIASTVPTEDLLSPWQAGVTVHEQTKVILSRWFNQEITSQDVLAEMEPVLSAAEEALAALEEALAGQYGFAQEELAAARQEALASISGIFEEAPTPAP